MRCVFEQKFWIDMVEKNKLERELTFRELEAEGGEGRGGGGPTVVITDDGRAADVTD